MRRHDHADVLALVRANMAMLSQLHARQSAWKERCMAWGRYTAERMDILGVQGWMKVELLSGDAPAAIQLFDAYVQARRHARAREADEALWLDAGAHRPQHVHDLLELLVLCYATINDLRGLVHTMQSFDVGSHTELFFDLAHARRQYTKFPWPREQAEAAEISQRALAWISHAELARGLLGGTGGHAGANRLARLLGSLFAKGDVPNAWRLIQAAMDAGVRPSATATSQPAWLTQHPSASPAKLGAWTDSTWAVCLSGLLGANRMDWAAQVWDVIAHVQATMPADAMWPSWAVWNAVLDGHSRQGFPQAVHATWRVLTHAAPECDMPLARAATALVHRPSSAQPDLICYTTMIMALFRLRQGREALALLAALQARNDVTIPVETYNAVLHGLCMSNDMPQAMHLLAHMGRGSVPAPTITTMNIVLRACARRKDMKSMAQLLREIAKRSLTPDVVTFTTVLDAMLRAFPAPGQGEKCVEQVMQIMQSLHVEPNSVTFTSMIKACLPTTREAPPRLAMALQLLHTMCTTPKLTPTPITFETVVVGLWQHRPVVDAMPLSDVPSSLRNAMPDDDDAMSPTLRLLYALWDTLSTPAMVPTSTTYMTMARALLGTPASHAGFRRGVCIADEMLQAHGTMAKSVGMPAEQVRDRAPPPIPASWTATLNALLHAHTQAADRGMVRRVLSTVLHHFHQSPHGEKALLPTHPTYNTAKLVHLLAQAQRVVA